MDRKIYYEVFIKCDNDWKRVKANLTKEAAINMAEGWSHYELTPARVFTQGRVLGRLVHDTED